MKPILEVRNLWKQYKIGGQKASYLSLRERITQGFQHSKQDTFWALQDINFDVYEGECIGIIGRNGAGKSTLLKILSQITPPTKGHVKARGRVASLLEVGTGFHPELTGRENIFLNGSILGLRRSEIKAKFDEIVDFSGVEQFLDTPLKHYSSGMRLRLAFSVAAYLEPEILLIDEVLAVGDAEFQKKCLGKMDEVSKSGRTILFVSHNLGAVQQLCTKGVLLNKGAIAHIGDIESIIKTYIHTNTILLKNEYRNQTVEFYKNFHLNSVKIKNSNNQITSDFRNDENILIEVGFELQCKVGFKLICNVKNTNEYSLVYINSKAFTSMQKEKGKYLTTFTIPNSLFDAGIYTVEVIVQGFGDTMLIKQPINLAFEVKYVTKEVSSYIQKGLLRPKIEWNETKIL